LDDLVQAESVVEFVSYQLPQADPLPRELTLEEEVARMLDEGCPNG
jgi:hypothetical protein